ncbi:hypothetical protein CV014_28420, partial [Nostoc sp. CMAA1605]|nr:hypothetical protein [Nostoc sp. CMAA1605]
MPSPFVAPGQPPGVAFTREHAALRHRVLAPGERERRHRHGAVAVLQQAAADREERHPGRARQQHMVGRL